MLFCPKCKSLLRPSHKEGKKVMVCSCGYSSHDITNTKISERVSTSGPRVEVVTKEVEANPLTEADCPKCGHKKAYYWLVQTRAGDEAETKFFKCEKCKHQWRDYS